MSTVISARKLFDQAARDFWRWKWPLVGTVAVLAVPLTAIGTVGNLGQDATFSAYGSFLTIAMNLALLWVIARKTSGQPTTIRGAYYEGTAPIVRFLLVAICLALMLIPFSIGALIYVNGVTGATLVASTGEKVVLGVVWAILSLPSLLLVTRFILSIFTVIEPGATPISAMRAANRRVKGHTWRVAGRLVVLGVVSLVILTIPTVIATTTSTSWLSTVGLTVVQLLSTLVILPISDLYLLHLYQNLERP